MSGWIITSWIGVAIMTAVNVFVFLKLKEASEKMLKMAFPNAKNMSEAMQQMQGMMGGMRGGAAGQSPDQLKNAMEMLRKMQQQGGRGPAPRR